MVLEELMWKGERAKQLQDGFDNDVLLNIKLDEEWEIHKYLNK